MDHSMTIKLADELMTLPEAEFDNAMLVILRQVLNGANVKREELGLPASLRSKSAYSALGWGGE